MSKAIGIRFVPYEEAKHLKNHFLGAPVALPSMAAEFPPDVMFLGMIDLKEAAPFDEDNALPHEGYLYFFLDASRSYRELLPIVRYVKEEPSVIIDDFNSILSLEEYKGIDKPRGIVFTKVEPSAEGCKLLGVPCDWNYEGEPGRLLLTVDHYDEELNFLMFLDGFTYIFFGPEDDPYGGATIHHEYS